MELIKHKENKENNPLLIKSVGANFLWQILSTRYGNKSLVISEILLV